MAATAITWHRRLGEDVRGEDCQRQQRRHGRNPHIDEK